MSAVSSRTVSFAFTSAPPSINVLTAAALPDWAASISGVTPVEVAVFTSAPDLSSAAIIAALPFFAAIVSGV
jgi:hypothetical protein